MYLKRSILVFICMLAIHGTYAQNQDFGIWAGVKVSKKWNKKWSAFGEVQTRLFQNATSIRSAYFQGGVNYKFAKWYKLGVVYRYTDFGEIETNRFDIDNEFRHKVKKNIFEIRLKYQKTIVTNDLKGNRYRVRFKYSYKINKKLKPYVKAQYFYTQAYDFNGWHQQRYTLGTLIRIRKRNFIDLFYNYDFEFNVRRPEERFIVGIKYKLELK